MKYSKAFEEDYNYYLNNKDVFNFDGENFYRKEIVKIYRSKKTNNEWSDWEYIDEMNKKKFDDVLNCYYTEGLYNRYLAIACVEPIIIEDTNGFTVKECFYEWDSKGNIIPCKEPILYKEILRAKGSLNLHIKMWAEDRALGRLPLVLFSKRLAKEKYDYLTPEDLIEACIEEELKLPLWVIKAVEEQKKKYYDSRYII